MAAFEELNVADKKKEMIAMPRHSFIQLSLIHILAIKNSASGMIIPRYANSG